MITDMKANKKLSHIVIEFFLRRKRISLVFISQSYFKLTECNTLFYHGNS